MTIRKKTKKIYEVAHDLETDTHTLAAEGDNGLSAEELKKMEQTVMAARESRRAAANEIREAAAEEMRRLVELDNKRKVWKKQRDKYRDGAIGSEEKLIQNPTPEKSKKGGCKSCAAKGLKRLIAGGAKLLKAELGMDGVSEEVYEQRKKTCLSCDQYDFGVCNNCSCFLSAKCALGHESCPLDKWGSVKDGK